MTGFEAPEIDLLLADFAPSRPDPDDILPSLPRNPVSRRRDLWQLGKHRLLCGDARQTDDIVRVMDGALASAVFCDPPYNVRVSGIGGRGRVRHPEFAFASGEMSQAQYRRFLSQTLANGVRISAPGSVHYTCIDWRHVSDLIEVGYKLYGDMLNLVVWTKSNAGQGSFYRSQHELIVVFRVGKSPHRNNIELGRFGRNRSNVWSYAGVNAFGHNRLEALAAYPTVKPVALVADALLDCTARGDAVLDQFAGSGTTILAAEKVGRVGFGIEYEPRYVDVAIRRWQKLTKLEATLVGDGRSFDEIAATRSNPEDTPMPPHSEGGHVNRKTSRPTDYEVGYARPPREKRFTPGKSGNPKGRPKGSRSVGAILQRVIRQKITMTENGKTRRLSALEVMFRRLVNDAMRGDPKAMKLLLSLFDRYEESSETALQLSELLPEDRAILA